MDPLWLESEALEAGWIPNGHSGGWMGYYEGFYESFQRQAD